MTTESCTFVSRAGATLAIAVLLLAGPVFAQAQAQVLTQNQAEERWYQIEVTVFAHSNAMLEDEIWPISMLQEPIARNTRPLDTMMSVYDLPDWNALDNSPTLAPEVANLTESSGLSTELLSNDDRLSGAPALRTATFRLPDPERDAFLALPSSAHLFQDTNRALRSDGRYRVMYHNAWRQPMRGSNQSIPVWLEGGNQFGQRHELEGSLVFRFNPGQDRVVLNARLWLTQFAALTLDESDVDDNQIAASPEIGLPDLPESVIRQRLEMPMADDQQWIAAQIIPVLNTRELRSNEFHYVDHPAIGILVQILPYTVPPLPVPEIEPVLEAESGLDAVPSPQTAPTTST